MDSNENYLIESNDEVAMRLSVVILFIDSSVKQFVQWSANSLAMYKPNQSRMLPRLHQTDS